MSGRSVWVVEKEAVYRHGARAVLSTREAAERFIAAVRPDRDGHHNWVITEMLVDEPPVPGPPPANKWNVDSLTAVEHATPCGAPDEWVPLEEEGQP